MISFLKSKFNNAPRRAVCIAPDSVAVYHWENGNITDTFEFDTDDTGRFHFTRYLQETASTPIYILVDVVEEEFRQDTIPHVSGSDRRNVLDRKLSRSFRNTPYVHHLLQGREKEGRKDDKVLLTALTNPGSITSWVSLLEQNKVPLAGIYSLPILSLSVLKKLKAKSSNILLVSLGNASGLRQTYFRDQQIKISRLAKMPRFGTAAYAPYVIDELDKLYRYLNNLKLLSSEEPLDIYVLGHGELLADLHKQAKDTGLMRYHLVDVAQLSHNVGIEGVLTTPFSDYLFAHTLLTEMPKNHYGSAEDTHFFSMHQTRVSLLASSMLILLLSTAWSGFNFIEGISLKHKSIDAKEKSAFYQTRYEMAKEGLPPTAVEPRDIKSAIDIVDTLLDYKSTPFLTMSTVSQVLNRYPDLQVDNIAWTTTSNPNISATAKTENREKTIERGDYLYYQVADIKGHLSPFDGNYRNALGMVRRFANTLGSEKDVHHVEINQLPLDIRSESNLAGETSNIEMREADFDISVVIGVKK